MIANFVPGHVIGLLHEHQRPDAADSVKFDCHALSGYKKAKKLVKSIQAVDEPAFTATMSTKAKMNLVLVHLTLFPTRNTFTYTVH